MTTGKPSVLFVCVHNAGRSQMAAGYLTHLSQGAVEVRSAGSEPADQINPAAVQAMAEDGIDITNQRPKILTTDAVQASDVVITMGCGDTCPFYPGKRYEEWVLDDPAGQDVDAVRPIRDEIKRRILNLLQELSVPARDHSRRATLEVLHVPDCPNLTPMLEGLSAVTSQTVRTRVIDSESAADQFGMAGSPTLLIDGTDPFRPSSTSGTSRGSLSCRLYRDNDGNIVPAPTIEQLRKALGVDDD